MASKRKKYFLTFRTCNGSAYLIALYIILQVFHADSYSLHKEAVGKSDKFRTNREKRSHILGSGDGSENDLTPSDVQFNVNNKYRYEKKNTENHIKEDILERENSDDRNESSSNAVDNIVLLEDPTPKAEYVDNRNLSSVLEYLPLTPSKASKFQYYNEKDNLSANLTNRVNNEVEGSIWSNSVLPLGSGDYSGENNIGVYEDVGNNDFNLLNFDNLSLTEENPNDVIRIGRANDATQFRRWRYKFTNERTHKFNRTQHVVVPLDNNKLRYHSRKASVFRPKLSLAERRRIAWRRNQRILTERRRGNQGHHRNRVRGGPIINHHSRVSVHTKIETNINTNIIPGTSRVRYYPKTKYDPRYPTVITSSKPPIAGVSSSTISSSRIGPEPPTTPAPSHEITRHRTGLDTWVGGYNKTTKTTKTTTTTTRLTSRRYHGYYRSRLGLLHSKYAPLNVWVEFMEE